MMKVTKEPGILGTFDPVVTPSDLPSDPEELVASIMDPARRGELYPLYHRLREVAPVHHSSNPALHGAWAITRFDHTEELFRGDVAVNDPAVTEGFNHGDGAFYETMRNMLVFVDSKAHARLRRLVVRAFTPRSIAKVQPITQSIADELLDAVAADGGMELVSQYAYLLPIKVIAYILGVPESDFSVVEDLAWNFARAGEKTVSAEVARRGDDAARGFNDYFEHLVARRRAEPADDLISGLIAAEQDGDRLSHTELVAQCILLLQAGHETTADLIGNSIIALFPHPDQLDRLRGDLELTKPAVEEFLRYDGSVQINHRLLLDDVTLGDVTVPAGDIVYCFLGAANRDPDRFENPDRLDISRDIGHHLAFSFGAYYCIGASLARTETAVGVRTLLDRFPTLHPARDTSEWRNTLQLRGPQELAVAW